MMGYDSRCMNRYTRWFPLVIMAAGWMAFSKGLHYPFIFDDSVAIEQNPFVYSSALWWSGTRWVVDLSFRINYLLGGYHPFGFRLVNVITHILAGLFLYGLVRRCLKQPALAERFPPGVADWLGFVSALVWVVHPLQTESVTYVCQRYESMMGLFFLATGYSFIRAIQSRHQRLWFDLSIGLCLVGMGTKEVMVTAPVMILILDHVLVANILPGLRQRWKVHLALMATWGVVMIPVFGKIVRGVLVESSFATGTVPYLVSLLPVWLHYLRLSVVPYPLCLDYAWPMAEPGAGLLIAGLVLGLAGIASVWAVVRRHPAGLPGMWFMIILAPTSIIPLPDLAFEHRMYLPLAAPVVLVCVGLWMFLERMTGRRRPGMVWVLHGVAIGLVVVGFVLMTRMRNKDYQSTLTMWEDVCAKRPSNLRAQVGLGQALLDAGQKEAARRQFESTLAVEVTDTPLTPAQYRTVRAKAINGLGTLEFRMDRYVEAEQRFRQALDLVPEYTLARNNLGLALQRQNRVGEAMEAWRDNLLRREPPDDTSCYLLGLYLVRQGDCADGFEYYRQAVALRPDKVRVVLEYARLLATCADPALRDGVEAARVAGSIRPRSVNDVVGRLDVLAMAAAARGDFAGAVKLAQQALATGREQGLQGLSAIEERLAGYAAGRPYIETVAPAP